MADRVESGGIGELIDRVARATRSLQFVDGLSPAQWEALRYVSRANHYSRHPSALAEFLGTTKGTVSQTLIALEGKGYLRRERGESDRRAVRLEITPAGRDLLRHDPLSHIDEAVADVMSETDRSALAMGLGRLLRDLQRRTGANAFGVCLKCGLHIPAGANGDPDAPQYCGLTGEALAGGEERCICVSFRSGA
ncbi:MAG: MarR family winged helix-turn-helix transcriptional regulator [Alphaproteobacteria bacterium]